MTNMTTTVAPISPEKNPTRMAVGDVFIGPNREGGSQVDSAETAGDASMVWYILEICKLIQMAEQAKFDPLETFPLLKDYADFIYATAKANDISTHPLAIFALLHDGRVNKGEFITVAKAIIQKTQMAPAEIAQLDEVTQQAISDNPNFLEAWALRDYFCLRNGVVDLAQQHATFTKIYQVFQQFEQFEPVVPTWADETPAVSAVMLAEAAQL
jgi:hypothetical protein